MSRDLTWDRTRDAAVGSGRLTAKLINMEQLVDSEWAGETKVLVENPSPVSFCPPKMPNDLTWDRTQT
jgi:hypothetical protein